MTDLLVSVRSVREAEAALSGGADIIDIKEPAQGSLGAATKDVVDSIAEFVGRRVPVSVALGELADGVDVRLATSSSLSFAKVGLSRCGGATVAAESRGWQADLSRVWAGIPKSVGRVAVAYADWSESRTPSPKDIFSFAADQAKYFLLDTYDKSKGLLEHRSVSEIDEWINIAKSHDVPLVVAGSIRPEQVSLIVSRWRPSCIAVRGAVCRSDRTSFVCEKKVLQLRQLLEGRGVARQDA